MTKRGIKIDGWDLLWGAVAFMLAVLVWHLMGIGYISLPI
jgi:hypothetical protein